jgi:LemA protein
MPIAGWVIIGIVVVLLILFAGTYNSLVGLRNQVKNAWAQIDVQLKRRHDLIPNLVETVKGYAAHERETLESVTNARNLAQGAIGKGVGYPDLKANQNFLALQEELTSTENKISFSRQFYNDSVLGYNNKTQMFPSNIIASITRFQTGEFFEVEAPAEREAPKVSFT